MFGKDFDIIQKKHNKMDKRYQIFISSTYSDLKEERNKVMQTIMSLDCIPAGMELFPAMDEEQFEFIKRIIDDCDYYLLIVGARYGSIDENGVSYTEKEYDYAVNKGIPVLAFLHDNIPSIPIDKADLDNNLRKKLNKFYKKVKKGRLVQHWKNADDLNAKVAISLPKTIKMFPRTGWVKANLMTNGESLQEINELRKENELLKAYKAKHEKNIEFSIDIADWNEEFTAKFTKESLFDVWNNATNRESIKITHTWIEWFKLIASELDDSYRNYMGIDKIFSAIIRDANNLDDCKFIINYKDLTTIRYQFTTYGVINKIPISHDEERWCLTKKGEKLIAQLLCVKTKKQ